MTDIRNRINSFLPDYVRVGYGTVYINTRKGMKTLKKLSNNRMWDYWHDTGIISMFLSMLISTLFIFWISIQTIIETPKSTAANQPKNVLAVPGVNEFIPIEQAGIFLAALMIAIIVHEGGHAISSLREGVNVKEWGVVLLLGIIPIGAYVLPDEAELKKQKFRPFSRVYSAGIMNNYLVTILTMAYFFFPQTPSLSQMLLLQIRLTTGNLSFLKFSVIPTFIYWNWFININLGIINTLPIGALDGGQVIKKALKEIFVDSKFTLPILGTIKKATFTYILSGVIAISSLLITIFGPLLL